MQHAIIEAAQDAIIVMDSHGRISLWNPAAEKMFWHKAEDVMNAFIYDILAPEKYRKKYKLLIQQFVMSGNGLTHKRIIDRQMMRKDGSLVDVQLSFSPIKYDDGWGGVAILRDVTQQMIDERALRESEQRYRRLCIEDPLTKLFNRFHFNFEIVRELNYAKRYNSPLSIIMFDVDDFKSFNDDFGHDVGDEVLELIGQVVLDVVRDTDIPCRVGGEEFLIILPMTQLVSAHMIAERIRKFLEKKRLVFTDRFVTVSCGVIQFDPHCDENKESLYQRVDQLMIRAKKEGKNRVLSK